MPSWLAAFGRARFVCGWLRLAIAALAGLLASGLSAAAVAGGGPQRPSISFWTDAPGGAAEVWLMDADGRSRKRLTALFSAKRGAWSTNGERLVFDGRFYRTLFDFDIGVVNADGTGVRRITRGPERDIMAVWSPDGRWIAFSRLKQEGGQPDLWLVRPNGTGAHRLVAKGSSPDWSPDGRRIAFAGADGLWTVRADGSGQRRLTRGEDTDPRWSPDGRRLVFTGYRQGHAEVYVARADGRGLRRLTRNTVDDYAADWSPDGARILFTHGPDEAHQVYVMNADGTRKRNLSRNRYDDWATSWR